MEKELIYKKCSQILRPYVKNKLMGPVFRSQIFKSIDNGLLLLEFDQTEIIGFCLLRTFKLPKYQKLLSLDKIAVNDQVAGKGIGKKLILKAIEISSSLQKDIRLDVVSNNINAIQFYKKFGFIETGKKMIGKKKDLELTVMIRKVSNE